MNAELAIAIGLVAAVIICGLIAWITIQASAAEVSKERIGELTAELAGEREEGRKLRAEITRRVARYTAPAEDVAEEQEAQTPHSMKPLPRPVRGSAAIRKLEEMSAGDNPIMLLPLPGTPEYRQKLADKGIIPQQKAKK